MIQNIVLAVLIILLSNTAYSSSIYKCTDDKGHVIFSSTPCDDNMEVIYEEPPEEIIAKENEKKVELIKELVFSNRSDEAKEFANANNMDDIYNQAANEYKLHLVEQERIAIQEKEREELAWKHKIERKLAAQERQISEQKKQISKQELQISEQKKQIDKQKRRISIQDIQIGQQKRRLGRQIRKNERNTKKPVTHLQHKNSSKHPKDINCTYRNKGNEITCE